MRVDPRLVSGGRLFRSPFCFIPLLFLIAADFIPQDDRLLMEPSAGLEPRSKVISWMCWWEANSSSYLGNLSSPGNSTTQPSQKQRNETIADALIAATRAADYHTSGEAALALGQMRAAKAFDALRALTKDRMPAVRIRAWAAIGLIDSEQCREFLKSPPATAGVDRMGWALAVGLLGKPTEAVWTEIRKQVQDSSNPEAQRMALWALRMHKVPGTRDILLRILATSKNPFLVAEAMVGLSADPQETDVAALLEIARHSLKARELPVIAEMERRLEAKPPNNIDLFAAHSRSYIRATANLLLPEYSKFPIPVRDVLVVEVVPQRMADGMNGGEFPVATPGTPNVSLGRGNLAYWPRDYVGAALISLGKLGRAEAILADALEVKIPAAVETARGRQAVRPTARQPDPWSRRLPERGFAAVALGLSQRGGGAEVIRPGTGRQSKEVLDMLPPQPFSDVLLNCYRIGSELSDVRAACAVGMGLSGDPRYATQIKTTLPNLGRGQEFVFGYSMLALAMLADSEAVDWTVQMLGPGAAAVNVPQLLQVEKDAKRKRIGFMDAFGRRATMQAMGILGDSRALPILIGQWGDDDAVSLEAARAIARCAKPGQNDSTANFSDAMVQLLGQREAPRLAALAAASLGAMHDNGGADRLADIVRGTPYSDSVTTGGEGTIGHWIQLRALGSPFYYLMLRTTPFPGW